MTEIVELTVVGPETSLSETIKAASEAKQSAVVVDGPAPYVLHVREILPVLREGKDIQVREVWPSSRSGQKSEGKKYRELEVSNWTQEEVAFSLFGYGTPVPSESKRATTPQSKRGVDFTILSITDKRASVETASEFYAPIVRGPLVVCKCPLDRTHRWAPDEPAVKGACDYDNAPLDCR